MSSQAAPLGSPNPTEALFRGLLESAPDGIVVVDERGTITLVNTQTERLFGYAREELLGKTIELLVPDELKGVHDEHRAGYVASPRTRPMGGAPMSLSARRRDGTRFPVEISLSPMHTDEGLLVTAAIRDITERKRVEDRLRASLQEKEVLLKEIHHRVKNNLQIVSSMLSLQMHQIDDEEALRLFRESQSRVHAIALFHEQLYQSADLAHVDIGAYLKGLTASLFATYGVSTDVIEPSVEAGDVPMGVDAAIACGLIVNELVSNSLKHAFPGGRRGRVSVSVRRDGERGVLEVRDDGVGVPDAVDLASPTTLGLRLVGILAEQVHGRVELERGEGARFIVGFERGESP